MSGILGGFIGSLKRPLNIEYLVVAGGGSGGSGNDAGNSEGAGGGGAGGMLTGAITGVLGVSYPVTVGAGGASTTGLLQNGNPGQNSIFGSFTSTGGGRGGAGSNNAGGNGGSGGGGGSGTSFVFGGTGIAGQGNNGGRGSTAAAGGGGGGAGAVGLNGASGGVGANGGAGLPSSITGTETFYAGGGAGGGYFEVTNSGGIGGGGRGGNPGNGFPGTANTGGGGGGAGRNSGPTSGAGGSGVVILRYPSDYTIVRPGLAGSTSFLGADKITTITAGTGNATFISGEIFDGSTELKAAPSAEFLRTELNITTSGNYWIKPTGYSGTAKLLWCDMQNQGGGWVLIGKGRASTDNNSGWFGTNNELSVTGLQQANAFAAGISKVDQEFVNRLMNGTTSGWTNSNPRNYMVVNRISNATDGFSGIGDSYYHKVTNQAQFSWVNQFGSTPTDQQIASGTGVNQRYPSIWLAGAQTAGNASSFIDNDFGSGNSTARLFTWHWSGHGALHGWSSGSSEFRGQQAGSEGHALQFVQLWAR
jgi:hypothetical protein